MPLRFLRFLSPEIREQEIQPRNFRSLEIDSPEIGWSEMRSPKPHFRNHRVSAETLDVCAARVFTIVLLVVVVLSANLITVHAQSASAQPQPASAERAMFEAANRERAAQGLAQLHWDNALANAAHEHALLMAQRNALSHQFPGEAPLQDRASCRGALHRDRRECGRRPVRDGDSFKLDAFAAASCEPARSGIDGDRHRCGWHRTARRCWRRGSRIWRRRNRHAVCCGGFLAVRR